MSTISSESEFAVEVPPWENAPTSTSHKRMGISSEKMMNAAQKLTVADFLRLVRTN